MDFRIGHGYDVHALREGLRLVLGGIEIPHEKGCVAHSDGDVAIHAVCDALLGAARAYFERSFSDRVFVISFLANVVTATLLVFLGNQLGVGSQLQTAVIVVLGIRIFSNVSAIRRFIFRG